jgi:hypothetical protein
MKYSKTAKTSQAIQLPDGVEQKSFTLLRLTGYIILVLSLIDYIVILYPLRLTDPTWEFNAIKQLVDHVWSPILGLAFVFFPGQTSLSRNSLRILSFLSWVAGILGLFYLLLLPLAINDGRTIYNNTINEITNQAATQTQQLNQLNQQINTTINPQQLNRVNQLLNPQGSPPSSNDPQELQKQLSGQVKTAIQNLPIATETAKSNATKSLLKEALRITLGALLSGVFLITVWSLTSWTRNWKKS